MTKLIRNIKLNLGYQQKEARNNFDRIIISLRGGHPLGKKNWLNCSLMSKYIKREGFNIKDGQLRRRAEKELYIHEDNLI